MPQRLSPIRKTFGVIGVLLRTFKHLDFARFISGRRTITYAGVPTGIRTPVSNHTDGDQRLMLSINEMDMSASLAIICVILTLILTIWVRLHRRWGSITE
jgi:hypothetical protein